MKTNFSFSIFEKFPNLLVALSLKEDGNMKIYGDFEEDKKTLVNREKFFKRLGLSGKDVVSAKLVHGDNIEIISNENKKQFIPQTDGLITNQKGVFLSITIADCLPVVVFDPQKEVISLLHCGWKGLGKKIIKKAVKKMEDRFDSNLGWLTASIGPGISDCHFEVKKDVLKKFKSYPEAITKRSSKSFIDLKMIARCQLEKAGVKSENIEISPICTFCQAETYFSYRKDKSKPLQTMIVVVGMKPN